MVAHFLISEDPITVFFIFSWFFFLLDWIARLCVIYNAASIADLVLPIKEGRLPVCYVWETLICIFLSFAAYPASIPSGFYGFSLPLFLLFSALFESKNFYSNSSSVFCARKLRLWRLKTIGRNSFEIVLYEGKLVCNRVVVVLSFFHWYWCIVLDSIFSPNMLECIISWILFLTTLLEEFLSQLMCYEVLM